MALDDLILDPRKKVVVDASGKATVTLTAEDWQLFTASRECRAAAEEMNAALADAISSGKDRRAAFEAVSEVMERKADFGASDSEPARVLSDVLDVAYGPGPALDRPFPYGDAMAKAEELREFFRSDETLGFLDEHCAGERPWALVMDGNNRMVLASPERDAFYVVSPTSHAFEASLATDAIAVIDPEGESAEPLGTFEDPSAAFDAVVRHAGLSEDSPSP